MSSIHNIPRFAVPDTWDPNKPIDKPIVDSLGDEHFFFIPKPREWTWWEKFALYFLPMRVSRTYEDPLRPEAVTITKFKVYRGMIYVLDQQHSPKYSGTITEEQWQTWLDMKDDHLQ